jgi:hypothetical protein
MKKVHKHSMDKHFYVYNFGILSLDIINNESPIMINGETYENKARNATVIPAAGIGRPLKYPTVGCTLNRAKRQAPARLKINNINIRFLTRN